MASLTELEQLKKELTEKQETIKKKAKQQVNYNEKRLKTESELTLLSKQIKVLTLEEKLKTREKNKKIKLALYPEVIKKYRFSERNLLTTSELEFMRLVDMAFDIERYKQKLNLLGNKDNIYEIYSLKEYNGNPFELERTLLIFRKTYNNLKLREVN